MASSNFPNRPFRLEERVSVRSQNAWNTGNNTLVHSELWIIKNSYSPTYDGSTSSYQMVIGGTTVGANNFTFDFRNTDSLLIHASDNWFANNSEGYLSYNIDGYCNAATLGYTEVHSSQSAPRIAQPAAAPIPWPDLARSLSQITTNSMQYQFSGTDLRGGALYRWEIQYADNAAFTNATIITSNGTSTITGLVPGKTYYFRSRAVTSAGNGSWSVTSSAKTLAAVYASNGTDWLPCEVYYSDGQTWKSAEVYYSNGTAWVSPTSL